MSKRKPLQCVTCKRQLEYDKTDWGYLDPSDDAECDTCCYERLAREFLDAARLEQPRVDESF